MNTCLTTPRESRTSPPLFFFRVLPALSPGLNLPLELRCCRTFASTDTTPQCFARAISTNHNLPSRRPHPKKVPWGERDSINSNAAHAGERRVTGVLSCSTCHRSPVFHQPRSSSTNFVPRRDGYRGKKGSRRLNVVGRGDSASLGTVCWVSMSVGRKHRFLGQHSREESCWGGAGRTRSVLERVAATLEEGLTDYLVFVNGGKEVFATSWVAGRQGGLYLGSLPAREAWAAGCMRPWLRQPRALVDAWSRVPSGNVWMPTARGGKTWLPDARIRRGDKRKRSTPRAPGTCSGVPASASPATSLSHGRHDRFGLGTSPRPFSERSESVGGQWIWADKGCFALPRTRFRRSEGCLLLARLEPARCRPRLDDRPSSREVEADSRALETGQELVG